MEQEYLKEFKFGDLFICNDPKITNSVGIFHSVSSYKVLYWTDNSYGLEKLNKFLGDPLKLNTASYITPAPFSKMIEDWHIFHKITIEEAEVYADNHFRLEFLVKQMKTF